jgi:hypothetical protein
MIINNLFFAPFSVGEDKKINKYFFYETYFQKDSFSSFFLCLFC